MLIADEVQTGFARTGNMFAMQHFGVEPDLMTLAKSMAGGTTLGERLTTRLNQWADTRDYMGEVRGLGAMVACTFVHSDTDTPDADRAKRIQQAALQRGLLLLTCGVDGNVIRFLFPLTIEDAVFEEGLQVLEAALDA